MDLLEQILDENEIDEEEIESSIDTIAKEYNKQDGKSRAPVISSGCNDSPGVDAAMKVDVEVLRRVYESFQDQDQRSEADVDTIDPEGHLFVIDAFEMPLWHWSVERGTFERCASCTIF